MQAASGQYGTGGPHENLEHRFIRYHNVTGTSLATVARRRVSSSQGDCNLAWPRSGSKLAG